MLEALTTNTLEYEKLSPEEMEKRGILGRLVGVLADSMNPTRNGRKYGEELWDKVFESPIMKERIENNCCFGELGHPADREETDMSKIAICMDGVPKKGADGKLRGVFNILNTPNGQILKSLCDYGCNIGISSRGSGDLITDFDGNESVDPDTYNCEGWDAVLLPAVKEARLEYVTESLNKTRYRKSLRDKLTEAVDNASEADKKAMIESLHTLGIDLNESTNTLYKDVEIEEKDGKFYCLGEAFNSLKNAQTWIDMNEGWEPANKKMPQWYGIDDAGNHVYVAMSKEQVEKYSKNHPEEKIVKIVCESLLSEEQVGREYFDSDKPVEEVVNPEQEDDEDKIVIESIEEDLTVGDTEVDIKSLQEALHRAIELEKKITELQEKLSASYARESKLKENVGGFKRQIEKLSKKSKEIEVLTEQLNNANNKISEMENDSNNKLSESLAEKDKVKNKLTESIKQRDSKIKSLQEELVQVKEQRDNKTQNIKKLKVDYQGLSEDYETAQKDLTQLKEQYSKKLEHSNELVEKYQRIAKNAVNKYIDSQAVRLGITSDEIKNRLPKSYGFKDIDKICEGLQEYKFNLGNLPFNTNLNEGLGLKATNIRNGLIPENTDDDITDFDIKFATQAMK